MNQAMARRFVRAFFLLALAPALSGSGDPGASRLAPVAAQGSHQPTDAGAPSHTVVAAGDIVDCKLPGSEATAKLLDKTPGTVLPIGDLAYPDGSDEDFECYDKTWGRHKARTRPAPGNHEYHTPGAAGYFKYFGSAAGSPRHAYYSFDLGSWHIISLDSQCSAIGGCQKGSPEERWLSDDLSKHSATCILAYWHAPLFSSGSEHGNDPEMKAFWDDLYAAGADIVLNGHDHDYERFAPQNPEGAASVNLWWEQAERTRGRFAIPLPPRKSGATAPLAFSGSIFTSGATIGHSSPWPAAGLTTRAAGIAILRGPNQAETNALPSRRGIPFSRGDSTTEKRRFTI